MDYIICHYHEIGLKGKNRKFFEEKLVDNIKKSLLKGCFDLVKRISGRIIIKVNEKGAKKEKEMTAALSNVFGISYFAWAVSCPQKLSAIKEKAAQILKEKKSSTFKIATQRSKKDFHLTSQQINEKVGEFIVKNLKRKVKLDNPGTTCFIEIVEKYAFLYTSKVKGCGGLPVGVSGKAVVLLSGGIDSPVASFLAMKRGIKVIFVHFHSTPHTDRASIEKAKQIIKLLNKFQFQSKLYLVPFAGIQKKILLKVPAKLRIIFYRRFMLAIAEKIAHRERALALVTGDSVAQVASQTLENIRVISESSALPILRPLAGYDKEEIIRSAQQIGTFTLSILPHQDCCARFLPKHPETKANIWEVKRAEKKLNVEGLINKTLDKTKTLIIK